MNAILREQYEAPVLTNEAIEVHLSYLRPALEAVQAELPVLHQKIEKLDEKLSAKIEELDEKLSAKIETLSGSLNGRIDQANKDREAGDVMLGEKIDNLAEQVMKIRGSQEGLKWFLSSLALIAAGVSIAHTLGWI